MYSAEYSKSYNRIHNKINVNNKLEEKSTYNSIRKDTFIQPIFNKINKKPLNKSSRTTVRIVKDKPHNNKT